MTSRHSRRCLRYFGWLFKTYTRQILCHILPTWFAEKRLPRLDEGGQHLPHLDEANLQMLGASPVAVRVRGGWLGQLGASPAVASYS
jgi:hypothetical protein